MDNKLGNGKKEKQGPERIKRRKRTAEGAERVTEAVVKHVTEGTKQKEAREIDGDLCHTRDCQYKNSDKTTEIRKRSKKSESLSANKHGGSNNLQTGKELQWQKNCKDELESGCRI